ncbi:hypothetical protein LJC64_01635 [Ruminococcaceae bacterium OttesenSCG-928-A11]|nr:hypothetical protein [Ruminococcaceae bacterium OttesenSCG-928-A11]
MVTLYYDSDEKNDPKTIAIIHALTKLERKYGYLLQKGWRFICTMKDDCDEKPYYSIDIQSDIGGGDYAEAKMSTLKQFPERVATGGETIEQLCEMLQDVGLGGSAIYDEVSNTEDVSQLYDDDWVILRDSCGIAPCYGGVRIPYEDNIVDGYDVRVENGEICLSFSGATEEQDLFFGLSVFKDLQGLLFDTFKDTSARFDLSGLAEIPAVKLWLDLLDIKEV